MTTKVGSASKRLRRVNPRRSSNPLVSDQTHWNEVVEQDAFSNEELSPAVEYQLEKDDGVIEDIRITMHWGATSHFSGSGERQQERDRFMHSINQELRDILPTTSVGTSTLSPDVLNTALTPDSLRNTLPSLPLSPRPTSQTKTFRRGSVREKLAFFQSNNGAANPGPQRAENVLRRGASNPSRASSNANKSQSQSHTTDASTSQPHDIDSSLLPSS